jgi:hypothetical protein
VWKSFLWFWRRHLFVFMVWRYIKYHNVVVTMEEAETHTGL